MRVVRISVSAQRKIPHPSIDYANISALVTLDASLAEGDDVGKSVQLLQLEADALAVAHVTRCVVDAAPRPPAVRATEAKASRMAEKHGGGA